MIKITYAYWQACSLQSSFQSSANHYLWRSQQAFKDYYDALCKLADYCFDSITWTTKTMLMKTYQMQKLLTAKINNSKYSFAHHHIIALQLQQLNQPFLSRPAPRFRRSQYQQNRSHPAWRIRLSSRNLGHLENKVAGPRCYWKKHCTTLLLKHSVTANFVRPRCYCKTNCKSCRS